MNTISKESEKKPRQEWSKSISINGMTKSLRAEELDNGGYLITYSCYGKEEGSDDYKDVNKKFFSKEKKIVDLRT